MIPSREQILRGHEFTATLTKERSKSRLIIEIGRNPFATGRAIAEGKQHKDETGMSISSIYLAPGDYQISIEHYRDDGASGYTIRAVSLARAKSLL